MTLERSTEAPHGVVMHPTLSIAPPTMSVRAARDRYLQENGFTTAGYEEDVSELSFFGWPVRIRNSEGRKRGLPLHDLHHVALGYGTDLRGECEISAWELRTGTPGYGWFVRYLIFQATVLGFVIGPRRTLSAWRLARTHRSLYQAPIEAERLLAMTVAELREHLGIPMNGVVSEPQRLHPKAPRTGGEPRPR
jgi:hypothetical protein